MKGFLKNSQKIIAIKKKKKKKKTLICPGSNDTGLIGVPSFVHVNILHGLACHLESWHRKLTNVPLSFDDGY